MCYCTNTGMEAKLADGADAICLNVAARLASRVVPGNMVSTKSSLGREYSARIYRAEQAFVPARNEGSRGRGSDTHRHLVLEDGDAACWKRR